MRAAVVIMAVLALTGTAAARPVEARGLQTEDQSVLVKITWAYNHTSIICRAVDERQTLSGRRYRLRDVQSVTRGTHESGSVRFKSGEVISLPEAGFEQVEAWIGTQKVVLECLNLDTFEFLNRAGDARGVGADAPAAAPVAAAPPADNKAAAKTIKLPAPADNVVAAGNGRYLLLHLAKLRKLAVFDAHTGVIVKFLPVGAESAYIAANAGKFVIVLPDQAVIQRWDLATLERELSVPLPEGEVVDGAAMGYASAGPLLLMRRDGPQLLNMRTLKPLDLTLPNSASNWRPHPQYPLSVRASADGSTFAAWEPGLSPAGIRLLSIHGATLSAHYEHASAGELLPAADGSLLFTSSGGVFSADLKPIAADLRNVICFPTYSPAFFLGVRLSDDVMPRSKSGGTKLTLYSASDRSTLVTLPALPEFARLDRQKVTFDNTGLRLSQRIHLMPADGLLVTIPDTSDSLIVHPFDLAQELDNSGTDYLFVSSMPLTSSARGATYRYPIEVRSKRGGVKFKLESGPAGMKVAPDGKLEWKVPPGFTDEQASVILTISDASGQEVYHSFNIIIDAGNAAASGREP